jgi:hypothetical protein
VLQRFVIGSRGAPEPVKDERRDEEQCERNA